MKHIQPWLVLKKKPLLFLISWVIFITFLSLVDFKEIDIKIEINNWLKFDKIVHFIFYFTLTGLLLNYFRQLKSLRNYIFISFLLAIIYGIIIEIIQDIIPTRRNFDYKDMFANTLGSIMMVIFFLKFLKKK